MSDISAGALGGPTDGKAGRGRAGLVQTAAAVAVLTLVAVGGGAGLALILPAKAPPAPPAEPAPGAAAPAETAAAPAETATPDILVALPPVLTNIANPPKTLLRIEASIVIRPKEVENPQVLAAQIQADTLAFARTLDIAQFEGARGLLHLREDLTERARLRSPAVVDYLIQSLVAE